ncbi:MAG: radical SAM protein [archaeon]
MTRLELEDFEFREEDDRVKFIFEKYYHFFVDKSVLEKIGSFKVHRDFIDFDVSEKTLNNKINMILKIGMDELTNVLGKKTVFIHRGSGIPLLGTNEFGIVDRDTNIIEVKAHTLCNLDCIYCSVDAGRSSRKGVDFVVEHEFLLEEFDRVASPKKKPVEASINPQGEPLMYSHIFDLVKGLKASKNVKIVSINTNGVLLTEELVDRLISAGLDSIHLSLNTLNGETASRLSGAFYPLEKVKKIVQYCDGKIDLIIAPIIVPGHNDGQIEELLKFCLTLKNVPRFGFQNFLNYQRGRNPVKQNSMDWFMDVLKKYQSELGVKLIYSADDFSIFHDEKIPKPFKKNQVVEAKVVCMGKYPREFIAVAENRCITVSGDLKINQYVKVKIVREKHNIFRGTIS